MNKEKPTIEISKNGLYKFENLKNLFIETKHLLFLFCCGGSSIKPFCDETHIKLVFTGEKNFDRIPDKTDNFKELKINLHGNRGHCTDNLPNVFRIGRRPWIDSDDANPDEVAGTIRSCPI